MRNAVLALALALAPAIATADAPRQFDLACKGTVTPLDGPAPAPWGERISVDLGAGAWCVQPCATPKAIKRVEPGEIWLEDDRTPENRDPTLAALFVNRATGELKGQDAGVARRYDATCAIAAFTPLPKALF